MKACATASCLAFSPNHLAGQIHRSLGAHLAHDVGAVRIDGSHRDEELLTDLLVRVAQCEQMEDVALAVADAWAPEHLEIQAERAAELASRVRNAGAVFVGPFAPVSLGDYLAGSNHVLPTGGTARHSGGLSTLTFLRGIHVVEYTAAALAEVAPHIDALGGAEDLAAHVNAVRARVAAAGSTPRRNSTTSSFPP